MSENVKSLFIDESCNKTEFEENNHENYAGNSAFSWIGFPDGNCKWEKSKLTFAEQNFQLQPKGSILYFWGTCRNNQWKPYWASLSSSVFPPNIGARFGIKLKYFRFSNLFGILLPISGKISSCHSHRLWLRRFFQKCWSRISCNQCDNHYSMKNFFTFFWNVNIDLSVKKTFVNALS